MRINADKLVKNVYEAKKGTKKVKSEEKPGCNREKNKWNKKRENHR